MTIDGDLKVGMKYGNMQTALESMKKEAAKIGGKVVKDYDKNAIRLMKNGEQIACIFQYTNGNDTTYRYNDSKGREYVGENTDGVYTQIYSGDGVEIANDKNKNGVIDEGEITPNLY